MVGIPGTRHATGMIPKGLYPATTFDGALVGLFAEESWGMGARELGEVVDGEGPLDPFATRPNQGAANFPNDEHAARGALKPSSLH